MWSGHSQREQESAAADCEPSGASRVRSRSGGLTALQMRDDAPRALLLPLPPLIASHRKHPVAKRRRICRPVLDTLLDLLIDALHPGGREAGAASQREALAPTRRGRRQGRPLVVALCSKHACSVTLIAPAHAKGRVPNTASRALGAWPSSAAPGLASPDSRSDRLPKSTCTFVCTSRPARRGGVCSRLLRPLPFPRMCHSDFTEWLGLGFLRLDHMGHDAIKILASLPFSEYRMALRQQVAYTRLAGHTPKVVPG